MNAVPPGALSPLICRVDLTGWDPVKGLPPAAACAVLAITPKGSIYPAEFCRNYHIAAGRNLPVRVNDADLL